MATCPPSEAALGSAAGATGLSRYLARRLGPLAVTLGVAIALVPPLTHYVIGRRALTRTSATYAELFAETTREFVFANPSLWRYSAEKGARLIENFVRHKRIVSITVVDEDGHPVPTLGFVAPGADSWWNRFSPTAGAPVNFNNRTVAHVRVTAAHDETLAAALVFLACSTATGAALAALAYGFPVRVVRKAERRIGRLIDELSRSNTELDSFAYSVSHDLKSPLVAIQGLAGLVAQDHAAELGPRGHRYLARIQDNIRHMERLTGDLLAFCRVGREPTPPETVELDEVLDTVLAEHAGRIGERGIHVVRHPMGRVVAVRSQMEQVFRNLVGNAVKYMGDTPAPAIEIGSAPHALGLEAWVKDNGIGIDPAYHRRIFEVFQRLRDVDTDGSGVGLPIVKKIVDRAGGTIRVESAPGAGATFRFVWPAHHPEDDDARR